MRPFLLRCAISAALCGAAPVAWAADAKPAAPPHSELFDATFGALRELQATDNDKLLPEARFKRLAGFHYSPATAAKLVKVFGTDQPVRFERLPPVRGQLAYRAALVPLHYTGADGMAVDWAELSIQALTDRTGRSLALKGSWPSLELHEKDGHFVLHNMSLEGKQHRGYGGVWYGSARGDIERMSMDANGAPGMALEGIHIDFDMAEHPKAAEFRYGIGVKAVKFGDDQLDDLRMVLRASNLDKRALAQMKAAGEKAKFDALTPEQQVAAIKPLLKGFMKVAIAKGTTLEIDEISAGFQGNRASIKGRVWAEGAHPADIDAVPALLKKIVARFDVKVPVALVRAVAMRVAQKQQEAQHPGTSDPQSAAQMAQTMTDVVVGKLLGGGYAKLDNDVLVSTIEWRDGTLRANGKEIVLPKPAPRNDQAQRGDSHWLNARRVAESCTLPDYPEDVVRDNKPLQFTMRYMVGADGHVHNLSMLASSELPDYDKALLAAVSNCTYIPALKDGMAVEVPMTWHVKREPGSARP